MAAMPKRSISFRVIEVTQPIGTFYIASIPARDLVAISYADVRRLKSEERDIERYLGMQRPVSPKRIREIRDYLESPDASFPTAIILAVDEKCAEYDHRRGTMTLTPYKAQDTDEEDIPFDQVAKILDGQHRLAGFLDDDENWSFDFDDRSHNRSFDLNVSIFVGADISEQATIFATVNLAQTKVNRSLVYDLQELARSRSPFRTCHNIAVALDETVGSPFYKRIKRLGVKTPGRSAETLTQAAFVESLVRFISPDPMGDRNRLMDGKRLRPFTGEELKQFPFRNMFVRGQDSEILRIVYNYFRCVEKKWPKAWSATTVKGNLLPRSNAFKALMRYLSDVYVDLVGEDFHYVPSVSEFKRYFDHVDLKDTDFTTKMFVPGSGGQATFYRLLTGDLEAEELLEPEG
jgi:DGQHR domain-containing protein